MAKRGGFPGGMPGNMNNLMKQAQKMQKQMEENQKALEEKEFTATAGGGAVEVTISGKKEVTKVKISEDAVDPDDVEMLEDLIMAATNEALRKVEDEAAQSMGASPLQIIVKVLIPESVPSLISNATIAITTILGYSAMSGIIGGGGLGKIAINYGYYRYKTLVMILAVILLIVMVQIFQSLGTYLSKKSDRRIS